jgi:carboxylate-amine ligase
MTETPPGLRSADWARWSPSAVARPWTVAIEEELMLLDPRDWSVADGVDALLARLPSAIGAHASAATHARVLELRTGAHATVADAAAELDELRGGVDRTLRERLGLRVASAGTHPLATRSDVGNAAGLRYRQIEASMRIIARREPTMGQHVHVAVPGPGAAVRALDGLRADLPVLLALSANSPYWGGLDSGFASIRTPLFSMFPRVGVPRHFGSYAAYVGTVALMLRSDAIPDPGYLWWDARLRPELGTVEVRIMDAQTRLRDAAALAAVIQCLVRRHAMAPQERIPAPELLDENRFLAARDGMRARLIDDRSHRPVPVLAELEGLLSRCEPFADGLDCTTELAAAAILADDPGEARQRRFAARHGIAALPERLAGQFTGPARETLAA